MKAHSTTSSPAKRAAESNQVGSQESKKTSKLQSPSNMTIPIASSFQQAKPIAPPPPLFRLVKDLPATSQIAHTGSEIFVGQDSTPTDDQPLEDLSFNFDQELVDLDSKPNATEALAQQEQTNTPTDDLPLEDLLCNFDQELAELNSTPNATEALAQQEQTNTRTDDQSLEDLLLSFDQEPTDLNTKPLSTHTTAGTIPNFTSIGKPIGPAPQLINPKIKLGRIQTQL